LIAVLSCGKFLRRPSEILNGSSPKMNSLMKNWINLCPSTNLMPPAKPRKKIGFEVKEKKAAYGKKMAQGKEKP